MHYLNKNEYTNQLLQKSLLQELSKKRLEQITVNDIITPLHLNRSTFYRHYDDKYNLLDAIETKILTDLDKVRMNQRKEELSNNYFSGTIDWLKKYQPELVILLGKYKPASFEARLQTRLTKDMRDGLASRSKDHAKVVLVSTVLGSISLNFIKYSVLNHDPDKLSYQETARILREIYEKGPIAVFNNSKK